MEYVKIQIEDPAPDFLKAKDLAKQKAKEYSHDPMLLSWCNNKAGEFYPRFECGKTGKAPWIVYADARGGNLTIDVNEGDYIFIYLKL